MGVFVCMLLLCEKFGVHALRTVVTGPPAWRGVGVVLMLSTHEKNQFLLRCAR